METTTPSFSQTRKKHRKNLQKRKIYAKTLAKSMLKLTILPGTFFSLLMIDRLLLYLSPAVSLHPRDTGM